jgi:hypothetical protein
LGSFLLAGDRLYVKERRRQNDHPSYRTAKGIAGEIEMDGPLYSLPSLVGDALWLTTSKRLPDRDNALNPKRV